MNRLRATCCLNDGVHWILIDPSGLVEAVSDVGFPTEEEALSDMSVRVHD